MSPTPSSASPKFTDLDLFLNVDTGEHIWPPRVRVMGEQPHFLKNFGRGQVKVPGLDYFDGLICELLSIYNVISRQNGDMANIDTIPLPPLRDVGDDDRSDGERETGVRPGPCDWGMMWHDAPLRVTFLPTPEFLHVAISRGLWPVPSLEGLGHNRDFAVALRRAMKRPGLLLFLGQMGVGKSTTMWSALIDHVTRTGIKAVVLEDIAELPAQGRYGDSGFLLQISVRASGYGSVIAHAMRLRAQHLVINEVRDHYTAREVLLAAGRVPVMMTGHGNDIEQGLAALRDLAAGSEGGSWSSTTLASSLVGVVHLCGLERDAQGGISIKVNALFVEGSEDDKIRAIIRHDQLPTLREHIRRQAQGRWSSGVALQTVGVPASGVGIVPPRIGNGAR